MYQIWHSYMFSHFQIPKGNDDNVVENGNDKEECISSSICCQDESVINKDTHMENVQSVEESVCNGNDLTSQNLGSKEKNYQEKIETADTSPTASNTQPECPGIDEQIQIGNVSNVTNTEGKILSKIFV